MKTQKFKSFTIKTLDNGLRVLIYPRTEVNSVSIMALVRSGHLCEKVETNGIAHITEHMLFDGTKKFPNFRKLNDFFDNIAGEFTGSTTFDFVMLGGIFVDEELDNALLSLKELIFEPLLNKEFLEKEKNVILDELSTLHDNNDYQNYSQTKRLRFKGNTILGKPLGGTTKSIKSISIEDIHQFYGNYYCPNNTSIIIVGKLDIKKTEKMLSKHFSKIKENRDIKIPDFSQAEYSKKIVQLIKKKSKKVYIRMTFPSYSWKDETIDRITLAYICSLLTNRRDSLLFAKLREKRGWIYDIDSEFLVSFEKGVFEIETSTPYNKSLSVIEEVLKAIKKIKNENFKIEYFEKIKDIDRKRMKMVFDTPNGIVRWFGEEMMYRYPEILLPADVLSMYDRIRIEDIKRVANRIFNIEMINIVVLQDFMKVKEKEYKEKVNRIVEKYT